MARGVPSMHPRKVCRNQGRGAATNAAATCFRRRTICPLIFKQLTASMRPCEACRCRHGAMRAIHAPAQGVPQSMARSCRKRCRYVLPPAHSLSAHFQAAGRQTSPSVAASMRPCEVCRCRHGARRAIHAPAQGLPQSRARSCHKRCRYVLPPAYNLSAHFQAADG